MREWRRRCRERLARPRAQGELVAFDAQLSFTDGSTHREPAYLGGSRLRPPEGGGEPDVPSWSRLGHRVIR